MKRLVSKLKLSHVTDVAKREFQEPMADQVMMNRLSLCLFVDCRSHLTNIVYMENPNKQLLSDLFSVKCL